MITPVLLSKYFAQQCTADEVRLVEDWAGESSENRNVFVRLKKMWDETGQVRPKAEVQETGLAWQKVRSRIQQQQVLPARRKSLTYIITSAAAAAVIVLTMVTFDLVNRQDGPTAVKMVSISTKAGERRQIALSDGSKVWMNAETSIKYPETFDGENREVYLEGEAYFEVAHNPTKPFTVHTGDLDTRVLGTSFNVLAYPENEDIEIALDEGKVRVNGNKDTLFLEPGFEATYEKSNRSIKKGAIAGKHNEWRNNVIHFENISLEEAVKTLERWYAITINIDESKLKNCPITASFENQDAETVLEIIATTLSIEVEKRNNTYYLKGQNCE
ncbi:MAG TPA: FecR domain-containing protein [Bacteroidia bacterium]|nr:FecR domain-containing protein [Bacteroidia bacterium]